MSVEEFRKAAAYIAARISGVPDTALVLGSGLGSLAGEVENPVIIPYGDIPGFAVSTAPGHAGRLVIGKLNGRQVLVMQGRLHCYEGHPLDRVVFPVRVFKMLGVKNLILTNAAGGVNMSYRPGDFMLISDHINLSGRNPLVGANCDELGPRFPDMSRAWDPALRAGARKVASGLGLELREGVYAWLLGPSYETPAEIRMVRIIGGDAVGMSTVPEAIAAAHCGLRTLGISCITNMAAGILDKPISGEEVIEISEKRRPEFSALIRGIVGEI